VKEDLRKEFASKMFVESLDKRVANIEGDIEKMRFEIEREKKKTKDNTERIDGHANRLAADVDII
jgi:hypothetical protein